MSAYRDGADWLLRFSGQDVSSFGPVEVVGESGPRVERLVCIQGKHWYVLRESWRGDRYCVASWLEEPACMAITDREAYEWLTRHKLELPRSLWHYRLDPKEVERVGFEVLATAEQGFILDWEPEHGVSSEILIRTSDGRWGVVNTFYEPYEGDEPYEEPEWPLGIPDFNGLKPLTKDEARSWCEENGHSLPADLPELTSNQWKYLRDLASHPNSRNTGIQISVRMGVKHDSVRRALRPLMQLGVIDNNKNGDGYFVTELGAAVLRSADAATQERWGDTG